MQMLIPRPRLVLGFQMPKKGPGDANLSTIDWVTGKARVIFKISKPDFRIEGTEKQTD